MTAVEGILLLESLSMAFSSEAFRVFELP